MDRGAWWAMVHRVTKGLTQLKQLSTHAPIHSSPPFGISFPFRPPQSIEQSSLCYTVGFYCLSIVYVVIPGTGEPGGLLLIGVAQSRTRLKQLLSLAAAAAAAIMYICQFQSTNSAPLPLLPWYPQVCFLLQCLCFCFANKIDLYFILKLVLY